ncbi:hypothetical protein JAAARDRAFT_440753 [Jaapia argillacea MUCL 33604]|uniref:Uncharacterized protein n=1 Tax=Jaapia argillacea MUCL 33604 TaxID=933084 RepID=A0A067PE05_9AGAM|nr:hypothetical protein JAAARDRAFT_440753 [Jaapia argillacea MUCL 33604]
MGPSPVKSYRMKPPCYARIEYTVHTTDFSLRNSWEAPDFSASPVRHRPRAPYNLPRPFTSIHPHRPPWNADPTLDAFLRAFVFCSFSGRLFYFCLRRAPSSGFVFVAPLLGFHFAIEIILFSHCGGTI